MSLWLIYSVLSGILIGSSFFFRKLATKSSGAFNGFLIEGIVYGGLILLVLFLQRNKGAIFSQPLYATLSAIALFFGALFLYKALSLGKVSVTNVLYMVIALGTVLIFSLAFLKEQLVLKQILGLILAVVAIFLLK